MSKIGVDVTKYTSIIRWTPFVGDVIYYTGLIRHWVGIIQMVENDEVIIVKSTVPYLLFNMTNKMRNKNTIKIGVDDIKNSPSSTYSIVQNYNGSMIWFI